MQGTGLYVGPTELLYYQVHQAIAEKWNVTNRPVYPQPFVGTTRLPRTPSLERSKWKEPTSDEEIAMALAHKLKECDTMHEELERLRNIERLVINTRKDQQAGKIPNDALLPSSITSLLPPIDTPTPPPILSDTRTKRGTVKFGGRRRKTTRRRKIRRRKTKRAKKLNKTK